MTKYHRKSFWNITPFLKIYRVALIFSIVMREVGVTQPKHIIGASKFYSINIITCKPITDFRECLAVLRLIWKFCQKAEKKLLRWSWNIQLFELYNDFRFFFGITPIAPPLFFTLLRPWHSYWEFYVTINNSFMIGNGHLYIL